MAGFRLGRPLAAAFAVLASGAAARADIQIAYEEVNAATAAVVTGPVIASFTPNAQGYYTVTGSTAHFSFTGVTTLTNSADPTGFASLTSTLSAKTLGYTGATELKVFVTDDGFVRQLPGTIKTSVGPANGAATGGTATITGTSTVFVDPYSTTARSTTQIASGTVAGSTPVATYTNGGAAGPDVTTGLAFPVGAYNGTYGVQQVFTLRPVGTFANYTTYGGVIGTSVTPTGNGGGGGGSQPVPAPPALLLGLLAVPALALRRFRG